MSFIRLVLFGQPHLESENKLIPLSRRKSIALLAYLALSERSHNRQELAALLWPEKDTSHAMASLRTTLSEAATIRNTPILRSDGETVAFCHENCGCDVFDFDRVNKEIVLAENTDYLTKAIDLYVDSFMRGFSLKDSLSFDDWQIIKAEGLRRDLSIMCDRLTGLLLDEDKIEEALIYSRKLTALDPLNEGAHGNLMRVLQRAGQRQEVIRQYQLMAMILKKHLGVEPSEESNRIFDEIVGTETTKDEEITDDRIRIAVMPLENFAEEENSQWLADSITATLITSLAGKRSLRVTSFMTMKQYRDSSKSKKQISRELDVKYLIEGSLTRIRSDVRISVQLIDVKSDVNIWNRNYSGIFSGILDLQETIAWDLSARLQGILPKQKREPINQPSTISDLLMEKYLQAKMYSTAMSQESDLMAEKLFREVTEEAPDFAPALTGLAFCLMALENVFSPPYSVRDIKIEIESLLFRASELAPSSLDTLLASGEYHSMWSWDWVKANHEYRRALDLYPGDTTVRMGYGIYLLYIGRYDESLHHLKMARSLDPGRIGPVWNLSRWYLRSSQYEVAISLLESILVINKDHWPAMHMLGIIYLVQENFLKAELLFQDSISICSDHPETYVSLGLLYARTGKKDKTRKIIEKLMQAFSIERKSPIMIALLWYELNDPEKTTAFLKEAVRTRDTNLLFCLDFPLYDSIKKTQLWKDVIGPLIITNA